MNGVSKRLSTLTVGDLALAPIRYARYRATRLQLKCQHWRAYASEDTCLEQRCGLQVVNTRVKAYERITRILIVSCGLAFGIRAVNDELDHEFCSSGYAATMGIVSASWGCAIGWAAPITFPLIGIGYAWNALFGYMHKRRHPPMRGYNP